MAAYNYPREPFYYSASGVHTSGINYFFYGPERNKLTEAYHSSFGRESNTGSLAVPAGVFICRTAAAYDKAFAVYGLPAGVRELHGTGEIAIDVSGDIGQSWRHTALPLASAGENGRRFSFAFTSPLKGQLAAIDSCESESGKAIFFCTGDGGQTWRQTEIYYAAPAEITDIAFVTARHAYMSVFTSQGSPVLETFDGGATWKPCRVAPPRHISSALMAAAAALYS